MADLPNEARDPSADHTHGIMEWPRIPGYEIEGRVGAGGMAVVFRARDERLRRPVALKILTPALAADDGFRHRFIREARAAAMVDDPHIIPVFAAGESDRMLFIAMRFVAGGDVRSLLDRSGAMSAGRAAGIVSAAASALDAAHRAGLVHRDVKPANMLIDVRPGRPDHVYVADFGLSKGALSSGGVTRAGHVVGTPAYLAPEQGSGGKVDGRTDQYSLACVAYELLTGVPPFVRDDAAAMIYAHLCEPPPLATARQPSLPSAVDSVLARAMSKNPEQRFLTCREFAESLRAALGLRPYDAGPGMNVRDGAGYGASRHDPPVPAVISDDRDASSMAQPSGSPGPVGPPPAFGARPGERAWTRRRGVRLSLTALALAALTVAGVVVAVRVSRSPEPVPMPLPVAAYEPVPGQLADISAGPYGHLLVAGYTCSECGRPSETDRPLLVEQIGSAWSRVTVPRISRWSRLTGISVSAAGTIYVVGYTCLERCGQPLEIDRPLILRWRDRRWSRFAYPSTIKPAQLTGVSVTATGRIFAVGHVCAEGCGTGQRESEDRPLILRSDGSRWSRVSSPSLPRDGSLSAISSQPDGNAWAAGTTCTPRCGIVIMHWNGHSWSQAVSPRSGWGADLIAISVTHAGGWASGVSQCKPDCRPHEQSTQTMILHWNGRTWPRVKSPSPGGFNALLAIGGAAGGTAWAAGAPSCGMHCGSSPLHTLILHWNGSHWRPTPSPAGDWWLTGIAAQSGGGAIAVGRSVGFVHACASPCTTTYQVDHTVILHLNGSHWSVVR